jgi:isopentenyl diphosphate isomerase/L-lactate dehydrogenase-like FMN-dependent dehydrogenase
VRAAVDLPCLRKDFLVDAYQIEEALAHGADAVLVIAAAVAPGVGEELLASAAAAGLDVLVEVHDAAELDWAVRAGAAVIGINNRDLKTFRVTLETAERLAPLAPPDAIVVAESGVRSAEDVRRMTAAGARAVLVGEAFMESRTRARRSRDGWRACPREDLRRAPASRTPRRAVGGGRRFPRPQLPPAEPALPCEPEAAAELAAALPGSRSGRGVRRPPRRRSSASPRWWG